MRQRDLGVVGAWAPCWSPDGRHLAFFAYRKGEDGERIFIIPAEGGGEVTELAADDHGGKWFLHWSPDGKWISYNSDGFVKTRPEGQIWEADFQKLLSTAGRE